MHDQRQRRMTPLPVTCSAAQLRQISGGAYRTPGHQEGGEFRLRERRSRAGIPRSGLIAVVIIRTANIDIHECSKKDYTIAKGAWIIEEVQMPQEHSRHNLDHT